MRKLTASILLAIGLLGTANAETTPATTPATSTASAQTTPAAPATETNTPSAAAPAQTQAAAENGATTPVVSESIEIATENQGGFDKDLSVWGMYQNADNVVKTVMIGLVLASVITWALFFSKGIELLAARRRLKAEVAQLNKVKSLDEAMSIAEGFKANSVTRLLLKQAVVERTLSAQSTDLSGIKDRTGFRLERSIAAISRHMGRGNGYLATIGAISPFVGLFGTVWGS